MLRKKSSADHHRAPQSDASTRRLLRQKESTVEQYLCEMVKHHGGMCVKLDPNLYPGIFDRLVVLSGTHLIETKRPKGGRLSKKQKRFATFLTENGAEWHVLHTREAVDDFIWHHTP